MRLKHARITARKFSRFIPKFFSFITIYYKRKNFMKTCKHCNVEQPLEKFYKSKDGKYGVGSKCKDCTKKYYQENKDKAKEYGKKYREENREKALEYGKEYRKKNKETLREYDRKRYRKFKF